MYTNISLIHWLYTVRVCKRPRHWSHFCCDNYRPWAEYYALTSKMWYFVSCPGKWKLWFIVFTFGQLTQDSDENQKTSQNWFCINESTVSRFIRWTSCTTKGATWWWEKSRVKTQEQKQEVVFRPCPLGLTESETIRNKHEYWRRFKGENSAQNLSHDLSWFYQLS